MAGFNMMALMNTASQSEAAKPPYEMRTLPIDTIIPNPANHYSMAGIDELADSILIAGRVLQIIVVKAADADGRYMLISGHRRHLACKKLVADGHAEFANIAALVENEADENMRELMLIYTNSTARELTDAEKMRQAQRATDILKQVKAEGKMDAPIRETVARMLNTTSGQLARYAAIANNLTNSDLKEAFEQEKIGVSVAYDSSRLSDEGQSEIADKLHETGAVTIRDTPRIEETGNGCRSLDIGVSCVEILQRNGGQQRRVVRRAGCRTVAEHPLADHGSEIIGVFASQLRRERTGIFGSGEASARGDDLQAFGRDPEPRTQASEQQRHLCSGRPPVEVCLVDNQEELLLGIVGQPLTGMVENRSLQRPHQHVLQHRVVGDEHIGRCCQDFVPREQLWVFGAGHRPNELAGPSVPPTASRRSEPSLEIWFGGPLP